ncbi:MAG: hypothetical protein OHK0039_15410 [Bacteroidia bacterium]
MMLAGLLGACRSQSGTPATYDGKRLLFGSGGGITGAVTTYHLFEDGQLYRQPWRADTLEAVDRVPRKVCKALFARLETGELAAVRFEQPGNMYAFVELAGVETPRRIVWDAGNPVKAPQALLTLYEDLQALTRPER